MATNFMAASRMRILRLFVTNNLDNMVNWIMVEDNDIIEQGKSTWDDLSIFEDIQLEVYLNASCCAILRTNVKGIATKRFSNELVLGMLEESIVDDIEEITPIILRVEEDIAYVAIFSKVFYDNLILKLVSLDKSIRFLQSFVYSTVIDVDEWTLFIDDKQQFLRVSKYQYFLTDNNTPIPLVVKEMLNSNKPNAIRVYTNNPGVSDIITQQYGIPCKIESQFEFGVTTWNFHNQKSTQFTIRLNEFSKSNLRNLLKTVKMFSLTLLTFWLINIIIVSCSIYNTESKLKQNFANIYPINSFTPQSLKEMSIKLDSMKHAKGIYSEKDAIPMLSSLLNIISNVGTNTIIQINYSNQNLEVFLNNNFDASQFTSYQNILATRHIKATIQDYKNFLASQKNNQSDNPEANSSQQQIDASWVITLQPSVMLRLKDTL